MTHARATGNRIYTKIPTVADKAAFLDAMSDWRPDGVTPEDQELEDYFTQITEQSAYALGRLESQKSDPSYSFEADYKGWIHQGIYLKSDNTFIGTSMGKMTYGTFYHQTVMFRPAYRGQGYAAEYTILGYKTLFEGMSGCDAVHNRRPADPSAEIQSITAMYDGTDIKKTHTLLDRIDPIEYHDLVLTKEQWTTWINAAENADKKAEPFEFTWYHAD